MAKENVKKFFEEASKNEGLQKQLKEATEKTAAEVQKALEAQSAAVVEVAKKAGFDFTAQEMLEQAAGNQKLDQGELDAVAGGKIKAFCIIIGGSDGEQAHISCLGKGHGGACKYVGVGLWTW